MMIVNSTKKMAHKILNSFGFDVVKLQNFNDGLAQHLTNVIKSRKIDCVLDVGANIGQYGKFLREIGFEGHIVSFEPVKEVFELLKKNSEGDNKWLCYNLALSNEAASKDINVYSGTQFSSFLDVNDYSKNIWNDLSSVSKEKVNVVRLDDMFEEIVEKTDSKNYYLKLDTQGFDLNVFQGAMKSLVHVKAMQSELSLISVYDGMQDPYKILNNYHTQGFFISGLYPINRDKSLAIIEYDCVLVRRD